MPNHPARPCEHCQRAYRPVRKAQKLCRPCRLLTDLDYWSENVVRPQKCAACESKFLRTNRNTRLCATCEPGYTNIAGLQCLVCGSSGRGLERSHTPICRFCARYPDKEVRFEARTRLREWLVPADPHEGVHPLLVPVLAAADAAASRLGILRDDAISQAKATMGLGPGDPTTDYAAVTAALEAL